MAPVRSRKKVFQDMTPEEINSFILGHEWKFARTMADMPHSYVVRKKCRSDHEFENFVMYVRKHGYKQKFGRVYYTYLDWPVGGVVHSYWSMGAPLPITIIINRYVKK